MYMIGIDAAPLWLLKELCGEKGLAGFKELLDTNSIVNMESTLPPMTGPAWPSIYTGLEPSQHGVPDFFEMKNDYTPELVFYDSKKFPPFWDGLAKKGKKCLIITPATETALPESPYYDIITGFPLPARTNSLQLEKLMKKYHFDGEPDIEKDIKSGKLTIKEAAVKFVESAHKRISIARNVLTTNEYDFVYVCFTETDRIQHFVMNRKDMKSYLVPLYSEISNLLEDFLGRAKREGAAVIVVSDHGAQPIKSKFLLNSWMIKSGYITLKDSVSKSMVAGPERSNIKYELREKLLKTGLRRIYDKMPHTVKNATSKVVGSALSGAASGDYVRTHLFDFEMDKSTAFAAISNDPVSTIWINDSRFRSGIVTQKEKRAIKAKIIRELKTVKDNAGRRVITDAFDAEMYYRTPTRFIAADIMVEAAPGYTIDIFYHSLKSNFMEPEDAKSGDHIRNGIFGFYPKTLGKKGTMHVTDVKPLVAKYFGV